MAEILIPKDSKGRDLSPIEAQTGVVLPIWAPGDGISNSHHPHFLKRKYLTGPRRIETRAVRFSRLQYGLRGPHSDYHEVYAGTAFPRNLKQSFAITVLNCAGYVPGHVVDMSKKQPEIRETSGKMKAALTEPGILRIEERYSYRQEIGQFLMYYAIGQNFDHVRRSYIEEFIDIDETAMQQDERARERKLWLGMKLTNIGIGTAVDPIDRTFHQARDEAALPASAPICAWKVVKDFVAGHEVDYFGTLEDHLKAA